MRVLLNMVTMAEVRPGDLVLYMGDDDFVIVNPAQTSERELPPRESDVPVAIPCRVEEDQVISYPGYITGKGASLIRVRGRWYSRPLHDGHAISPLEPNAFFEIHP